MKFHVHLLLSLIQKIIWRQRFLKFFLINECLQQKVIIEVKMKCKKCQSKALEIAVGRKGVTSVAFKGESKNQLEVIGEGIVDAAGLAETLRKKVGYADLVSVEEVRER
ncbi:heavy metal-associated isoprenylated plant protein 47-like [Humulus lupulus]|uniref:heavy metal-associated isoprenylated plant protein 47-like n=1 Tax=Humulus lupulus TaxID=3486 RepID=UPI002B40FD2B|nr:heavy metal-associated isoprenylated plant protein 47-like [Humulus lupulus]